MKKIIVTSAAGFAAAVLLQVPGHALAAGEDAAKSHGCLTCHAVDKKKVGPAYKDVAAKFKGKSVDALMADMKSKPVHKSVLKKTDDAALKEILGWVLSL